MPRTPGLLTRRQALGLMGTAAAGAALGLGACAPGEPAYVSPYDWNALVRDGERLAYAPEGVVQSRWGIDVSEHQFDIDWPSVAAAGVQFAFVRVGNRGATEGVLYEDECFMANATGAHGAGIAVSAYFFSQAIDPDEVAEEADLVLAALARAEEAGAAFEMVAFDHEPVNIEGARANEMSGKLLTELAITFCERMQAAGYVPLIYGNQRDIARYEKTVRQAYPIWLAEYDVDAPTAQFDFQIWQYSNAGQIPGISTEVDLDLWLPLPDDLS